MNKQELLRMFEDEVADIIKDPIREPESKKRPQYKPVLRGEDDIDDMLFYTGNPPEEVKEKRKKNTKQLLSFGNK